MPVIGDPAAFRIDPEAIRIALARDAFELRDEELLLFGVREAVRAPDDHRGPAHQAIRDPALVVLVMPRRDVLGAAERAAVHQRSEVGDDGGMDVIDTVSSSRSPTSTPCSSNAPCSSSSAPTYGTP